MLSIGKLATGQAEYYLEQAHGSVTRAAAVSSGVEDYYLGGPEADGIWAGAGAAALGLRGTVGARELDRVLNGEHPGHRRAARTRPQGAGPGLRSDLLGAEERQRPLRHRRRRAARHAPRRPRPGRPRRARLHGARSGGDAARAGRRACDRRQRVRRGGVPASHLAGRRPAAAHPCPRRQPDPRRRRAMVHARRAPHLRARQDRRLPLRSPAARAAHARARRRVGTGAQRDRRDRRRRAERAAGVQPTPRRHRGRARAARSAAAPRLPRSRRCRPGVPRTIGSHRNGSFRNGASAPRSSG